MVEYDQSTAQRREIEIRRERREQLETQDRPPQAWEIPAEEVSYKYLQALQKAYDWYSGQDDARATQIKEDMDEVRRQLRARKHGGSMATETQGLNIDQGAWDGASSGGWSIPPVLPAGMTPGVLAEIQPNNSKGGFANNEVIIVFDTDEENGSYHAPIYANVSPEKALFVLRRIGDALGFTLEAVNAGEVTNVPCLIEWEENSYDGKVRVKTAHSLDTEGL